MKIYFLDQEVSIGDTIKLNDVNVKVTQDLIDMNQTLFHIYIFTTIDGVEIKKGDNLWVVHLPTLNYWKYDWGKRDRYPTNFQMPIWKLFSTRDVAEKWIHENKNTTIL